MPENTDSGTLNTTASEVNLLDGGPGGLVSPDSPHFDPDTTNELSDLDGKKDADAPSAGDATPGSEEPVVETVSTKVEPKVEDKPKPYHEDPAWQRIMKERDDARIEAARLQGQLEASKPKAPVEQPPQKPYIDITTLTDDQIAEWQRVDPKGYAANQYVQVREEAIEAAMKKIGEAEAAKTAKSQEELTRANVNKTYNAFAEKHPDFKDKWASQEIQKFMMLNPGHNPMSAYLTMTADTRMEEATTKAAEDAAKKATADAEANLKAKRNARVLTTGPGGVRPTGSDDAELQNTKEKGGLVSALAARLVRLRTQGA